MNSNAHGMKASALKLLTEFGLVSPEQLVLEPSRQPVLTAAQLSLLKAYTSGEIDQLCFEEHLAADPALARHVQVWRQGRN